MVANNIQYYLNQREPCPPMLAKECLKKENYLSEFSTKVDKEVALRNLGVPDIVEEIVDDKVNEVVDNKVNEVVNNLGPDIVEGIVDNKVNEIVNNLGPQDEVYEPNIENLSVLYYDKVNKKFLWWDGEHFVEYKVL